MKLQLDENTLNAYINEAIKQELNERLRIFTQEKLRYQVDFGLMEQCVGKPYNLTIWEEIKKSVGGLAQNTIEKLSKEFFGVDFDTSREIREKLEHGTFGEESFVSTGNLSHYGQKERQRAAFIDALRGIGYSDKQIHDALQYSWDKCITPEEAPIRLGNFDEGNNEFVPLKPKKADKAWEEFLDNSGDSIINPKEDEPKEDVIRDFLDRTKKIWEAGGGLIQKVKNGFDNMIDWGKQTFGGKDGNVELVTPEDNDKNINWDDLTTIPDTDFSSDYQPLYDKPDLDDDAGQSSGAASNAGRTPSAEESFADTGGDTSTVQDVKTSGTGNGAGSKTAQPTTGEAQQPTVTAPARTEFPWDSMPESQIKWTPVRQPQKRQNTVKTNQTATKGETGKAPVTPVSTNQATGAQTTHQNTASSTSKNATEKQPLRLNPGNMPHNKVVQKSKPILRPQTQTIAQSAINNMSKEALNNEKSLKERLKNINFMSNRVQANLYKLADEGHMTIDQAKAEASKIRQAEKTIKQNLKSYEG